MNILDCYPVYLLIFKRYQASGKPVLRRGLVFATVAYQKL